MERAYFDRQGKIGHGHGTARLTRGHDGVHETPTMCGVDGVMA